MFCVFSCAVLIVFACLCLFTFVAVVVCVLLGVLDSRNFVAGVTWGCFATADWLI